MDRRKLPMDRRKLIVSGLVVAAGGPALAQPEPGGPVADTGPRDQPAQTYDRSEMVNRVSDFMGVTAEAAGGAIESVFKDKGRPTGYIAGEEGSGAAGIG